MGKRLGCGGAFLVPQEQGYFVRLVWPQLRVAEGAIFPHHPGPLWAADDAAAFLGAFPAECRMSPPFEYALPTRLSEN